MVVDATVDPPQDRRVTITTSSLVILEHAEWGRGSGRCGVAGEIGIPLVVVLGIPGSGRHPFSSFL